MAEEISAIRCMQFPLLNMQLLLPNSAVAEIIGYSVPEGNDENSGWYHGLIDWRGVKVPVISIEHMCEMDTAEPGARTRIAVIYNPRKDKDLPYLGLIMQDIPRAYLAEEDRLSGTIVKPECKYLLTLVDLMLDQVGIPNLDAIADAVKTRAV